MADALDLLTLAEGYRAVNDNVNASAVAAGGAGSRDAQMAQWITAISRRIDDACGPVVRRSVTEVHDGGDTTIALAEYPVVSVTSITEYAGTSGTALAAEDFPTTTTANDYGLVHAGRWGVVERRAHGAAKNFASGRVVVTYIAGRYADTASVDPLFKEAAAAVLRRLVARDGSAWARGGDVLGGDNTGVGFFRVVDPVVDEFLFAEKRMSGVA